MNRLRRFAIATLSAVIFIPLGCGDEAEQSTTPDPVGPTPSGPLVVSLVTPSADDGAIVFTVEGGAIEGAAVATAEHAFFFRETGAASIRVALVGDLEEGELLEIEIPDGSDVSGYEATIVEVADRANELRADLSGYDLTVTTP